MASDYTERWIRFFTKAGIPSRAATTYALTFADNRIQMDMLLDLNKEYLRDMGITLMGDVIAILRHARQVHEELTHEKLLHSSVSPAFVTSENTPASVRGPVSSVVSVPSKVAKPLKPSIETLPKSASSSSQNSSSRSPSGSPPSSHSRPVKKTVDHSTREPTARSVSNSIPSAIAVAPGTVEKSVPKRLGAPPEACKRKSAEISRNSQVTEIVIDDGVPAPLKKVRRVLPEHEGGYKIKMPSGSTPRSQQILAKQKELTSKKTVFERLGGSSSSPTPDPSGAVSSTTSDPVFAVTGLGNENTRKKKPSSVFSRLGDKQVSSTSAPSHREDSKPLIGPSMVADSLSSSVRSELRGRIGTSTPSVKPLIPASIGIKPIKPRVVNIQTAGILAGHTVHVNKDVKTRLGETRNPSVLKSPSSSKLLPYKVPLQSKSTKSSPVNGSLPQPVKKVSFLNTTGSVSSKAGVFSRLGR